MMLGESVTKVVLDTSALLSLINKEKSCGIVRTVLPNAVISSVSLTELISVMTRRNIALEDACQAIAEMVKEVIAFDSEQAYIAGYLEKISREHNLSLSLGDRACIALGQHLNLPIYTADKIWKEIPHSTVKIELIR